MGGLCKHSNLAVVLIVREFYANGIAEEDFKVMVRGKKVPFDRTIINKYYELEDVEEDEYHPLIENDDTD